MKKSVNLLLKTLKTLNKPTKSSKILRIKSSLVAVALEVSVNAAKMMSCQRMTLKNMKMMKLTKENMGMKMMK